VHSDVKHGVLILPFGPLPGNGLARNEELFDLFRRHVPRWHRKVLVQNVLGVFDERGVLRELPGRKIYVFREVR